MRTLLIAAVALAATAAPVLAAAPPGLDVLFSEADANHDGVVTRSEFVAARASHFDQLDRHHLGYLSMDQRPSRPRARSLLQTLLATADADHDGRVTQAEFDAAPTPAFDQADTNHDGVVDRAEAAAFAARDR